MNKILSRSALLCTSVAYTFIAGADAVKTTPVGSETAVTVYNQNFGVVRETVPLDLKPGLNQIAVSDTTSQLEPDSVVLRDPVGKRALQIVEQSYRADPVSMGLLLSLYEGKTIDFRSQRGDKTEIIRGKIIRSGYTPTPIAPRRDGYYYDGMGSYVSANSQPVIEVDGVLRFSLPGEPLFPVLPETTVLKPTLSWLLRSDTAGPLAAELAYITGGLSWKADYNVVAPDTDDKGSEALDMTGWVTLSNTSGKTFDNARIKLMAGDVNKVQQDAMRDQMVFARASNALSSPYSASNVAEKSFDDYHLYSLNEPTTLRDRETKQVEMIRATGVKSARIYVYDGLQIDRNRYNGYNMENIRADAAYGTQSNTKVWTMREFANTRANGLGIPLPKGRMRFYRRDADGQLEFTGENTIDHTPQGETVRVYTGNSFDIVGDRKRTAYKSDSEQRVMDETFAITLRNRKKEAAEVRIVEHLYRGPNWTIPLKSNAFVKADANTAEFRVQVPADGSQTVTYTVHYTW